MAAAGAFGLGNGTTQAPVRPWESFDPALVERTPNVHSLLEAARMRYHGAWESAGAAARARALYETVAARFTHGPSRATVTGSWPLWMLHSLRPNILLADADRILAAGSAGACSQIATVLAAVGRAEGLPMRLVHFNGHVVTEAWHEGDWHLYDADFEIAPEESGRVLSADEWSRQPERVRSDLAPHGDAVWRDAMTAVIVSREDNSYVTTPAGSYFIWKAEIVAAFERVEPIFRWGLPTALLFAAVRRRVLASQRRVTAQAAARSEVDAG